MSAHAQIFSVQHFCVHDGPGIRSVVFLKGCPLRCSWCQNPESWSKTPELGHKQRNCIDCGTCVSVCPTGAMKAPGHWSVDDCTTCFRCVEICPGGALTRFGEARSPEDMYAELAKEFSLYRQSGGGVTFSGGEASLFPEYVHAIQQPLKAEGIHTAMETCGLFHLKQVRPLPELLENDQAWKRFSSQILWQALQGLDLLLFDLKIMDPVRHQQHCGADNARILDNFALMAGLAAAGRGPMAWPRLPLVPGITDDEDNVRAIARFIRSCGITTITLLPYHNLGAEKFEWLHKEVAFVDQMLPVQKLEQARHIVEEEGLRWYESGEEDYARTYE